ncbi:MAG TPA: ABC transporter permease [Armatimonadota bacterium]|nr:ABC transporter permease [Armatimonadota bacterium]
MAQAPLPAEAAPSPGIRFLEWAGELALLLFRVLGAVLRGKLLPRETLRQMSAIGVNSVPIALVTIAFSGMVLALHTANQLKRLGVESLIGGIVAVSMAREAAPVLTAIVVAARVGSAIAAELGTMAVTEQVDALRSLGVSPVEYLVVPRFLAAVLTLPILTLFANVAGIAGGYIVSVFGAGVHGPLFLNSARNLLQPSDVYLGLAKTFVFGAIIAVVGCSQGLRTSGGAAGVGRSTTAAVVTSIVLVYVADYFLAEWMFGNSTLAYR